MTNKKNKKTIDDAETPEAILENVFGVSIEISPNLKDVEQQRGETNDSEVQSEPADQTESATQSEPANQTEPETKKVKQELESQPSQTRPVEHAEAVTQFSDLPLIEEVQEAIKKAGYQSPTPIQAQIIPHLLVGRDVLAQSQTGSGKTAAFALPILTRIETECREPQVLVLVPTRELAIQVAKSFATYGSELSGFNIATIYGGQDYEIQYRQLRKGPQVVVGTPGRVIDHIKNEKLDVSEIECLVLDEADEMLNMGFLEDVEFVLERAPEDRQIALFSATLPEPIRKISKRYLDNPAKVTIKQKTLTADSIRQRAVLTSPRDRVDVLIRFLEAEEADGSIVFTRTRESTNAVADKLTRAGLNAFAMNGEMPQAARERTIEKLKSGQLDILVATDIAARGLDVSRISHVFNYDLPEGPEAYTHRIGRTGRAGKKGEAIILLTRSQQHKLKFIEKITRQSIEIVDPPSADEINKMRIKRFYASITNTIENRDMHFFEKLVADFLEQSDQPVEKVAAAIAMIGQNGRDFLMKDRPKPARKERSERNRNNDDRGNGRRSGSAVEDGMTRYRIAVGKQDGVRPGNIVGAITNESNLEGEEIGSIRIYHSYSTIDLPTERGGEIVDSLSETRVSGRPMRIRPYQERPENRKRSKFGHKRSGQKSNSRRGPKLSKSDNSNTRRNRKRKPKATS